MARRRHFVGGWALSVEFFRRIILSSLKIPWVIKLEE